MRAKLIQYAQFAVYLLMLLAVAAGTGLACYKDGWRDGWAHRNGSPEYREKEFAKSHALSEETNAVARLFLR